MFLALIIVLVAMVLLFSWASYSNNVYIKFAGVGALMVMASAFHFYFEATKGWPTTTHALDGQITGVIIVEPKDNDPGAIYLWVLSKDIPHWYEYRFRDKAPRSHYIPYNSTTAKEAKETLDGLKAGLIMLIQDERATNGEEDEGTEDARGAGVGSSDYEDDEFPPIRIIDPQEVLPK